MSKPVSSDKLRNRLTYYLGLSMGYRTGPHMRAYAVHQMDLIRDELIKRKEPLWSGQLEK